MTRTQRVRDPVHNLIEFDSNPFEQTCWKVLNTRPMQRLRRIKQLGFSDFVYPGAVHSRLAHSIGVFHTARQLTGVVSRRLGTDKYDSDKARLAIAAALVHDVGHGPFSHAFEDALKRLKIGKRHEMRTEQILQEEDVQKAFEDFPDFPRRISNLVQAQFPSDIYASLVSSQFDADRLDYMRRDRLMSGTQQSAIDYDWLIANLQVHSVPISVDGERVGKAQALVIDEKSIPAAEGYLFSLFYLYVNVYYHKTTRGLEKIFSALIELVAQRVRDGQAASVGLPSKHPLVRFLEDPDGIEPFLELDDTVILGSLSMLSQASDVAIAELAARIRDRKIYACVDVSRRVAASCGLPRPGEGSGQDIAERFAEVDRRVARVGEMAIERGLFAPTEGGAPGVLEDTAPRNPYNRFDDPSKPFSPIYVVGSDGELHDIADMSMAVNSLRNYKAYRMYARAESDRDAIEAIIKEALQ
jgi:uncharacterized protein